MRGILRGFAWFLGSLVVAAIVLRATVFDVWTVTDVSRTRASDGTNDLAPGDVVLVLRDGKPLAGNVARCAGTDGKTPYAMRVSPPPIGSSDPDDLPKPARIAAPRTNTPPKRARTTTRNPRETRDKPTAGNASTASPVSAPAEQPAAKDTSEATTCRRVIFRLWGEKGPQEPERRFSLID